MSNQDKLLISLYLNPDNIGTSDGEKQRNREGGGRPAVIVAMKGHPGTGKSTLAWSLATMLRFSFISLEDFRDSLAQVQQFFPETTAECIDDLSYEAVCRVASSFVQSGSDVVIDCPLSLRSHCDVLLQVSNDVRARFVIVECKPQNVRKWRKRMERHSKRGASETPSIQDLQQLLQGHGDYDVPDIRKLAVNTTFKYYSTFDICKAVAQLSKSSRVRHKVYVHQQTYRCQKRPGKGDREETELHHTGHDHEFIILEKPKGDYDEEISCKACLTPISATAYRCNGCKFFLHKTCAELPYKVQILPLSQELPILKPMAEEYSFPNTFSCFESNDNFSFGCRSCLFKTHLRCGFLPSVINHQCDEHFLFIQIQPVRCNYEFRCRACSKKGKHISYMCPKCDVKVHVGCALLPFTIKHRYHRHPLSLTPFLPQEDFDDEFYCDICETELNPKNWIYYCVDCKFASHLECANSAN